MKTRFVDLDDGTISDTKTGLVWQATRIGPMSWPEAMTYAKNLELASHTDWRLPTIEELFTLVDFSKSQPATDFPGMSSEEFWSSTSYAAATSFAWHVCFHYGYVNICGKATNFYARCVRG